MQTLSDKYSHIKGWGIDADPENEPTYPIKKYTGEDHVRLEYPKPQQQEQTVEILKSIERPALPAVFGTPVPPSGISGKIRRFAFKYSESDYRHWLPLLLADRVNVVEGIIADIRKGHVPNIFAEKGWRADWKFDRKKVVTKVTAGAVITGIIVGLIVRKAKK